MTARRIPPNDLNQTDGSNATGETVERYTPDDRTTERSTQVSHGDDVGARVAGDEGGRRRSGFPMWLLLLLGLLLLGGLLWLLFGYRGGVDQDQGAPSADPPAAPEVGGAAAGSAPGTGALMSDGTDLFTLPAAASLSQFAGQPAEGREVVVQQVVSDEGFWVGTSEADRRFVRYRTDGESAFRIEEGQRIDVTGTVEANPSDVEGELGVTTQEGASQLTEQGHFIEATRVDPAQQSSGAAGSGALTSDGASLLPIPDGGLGGYAGKPVEGTSVPVQSVVADEGFWVGADETNRVFVRLNIQGESPFQVRAGQPINLSGTVKSNPADFAGSVGVTAEEGAPQLDQQGHHIQANRIERP